MFFIAIRQMLAKKKQTTLIFLGISFASMIYVIIAGMQLGMREYISEQLLNNTAHVIISGKEDYVLQSEVEAKLFSESEQVLWQRPPAGKREESKLDNPSGWYELLNNDPRVYSYAPRLNVNGIVRFKEFIEPVNLTGIVPEKQLKITSLEDYMKEGSLLDLRGAGKRIVLGSKLMHNLGVLVGDTVLVQIGLGSATPFRISGKIHLGNEATDKSIAIAHIRDVQQIQKTPNRVNEIAVALYDINLSNEVASEWNFLGHDTVKSWIQANESFKQIIAIQDLARYVITGAILMVSAFGIYNILSIMIAQKNREIAILRSIGYTPKKILTLFMIQGLLLGVTGAAIGLVFGHLLNLLIESIDIGISIGKGNHLIVSFAPSIYVTAFVASQVAAFIASILPARQASKLTPIDVIRRAS